MISSLPKPLNRRLSRFYSESQLIVWYPWKQLQGLLLELQKIRAHNCTVKMMKHTNTQHNASVSPDRRVRKMLRPVGPTTRDGRAESQLCLVSQRESKWIKWPSRQIFRLYFHLPLRKSLAACSDLRKRDISEHMDTFALAILNVNCCQDWVRGWQQPLANCDTERENRKRKTVSGCWRNILNL